MQVRYPRRRGRRAIGLVSDLRQASREATKPHELHEHVRAHSSPFLARNPWCIYMLGNVNDVASRAWINAVSSRRISASSDTCFSSTSIHAFPAVAASMVSLAYILPSLVASFCAQPTNAWSSEAMKSSLRPALNSTVSSLSVNPKSDAQSTMRS